MTRDPEPVDAYDRMTELEISSERFDQRRQDPSVGSKKYLICTIGRSGSFLLCRQLINAGIGVPQEYFNPVHSRPLCSRWQLDPGDLQGYMAELHARRTTPNGAWGMKLHWPQLKANRAVIASGLLDDCSCIFLSRTDLAAQAVSHHISIATGIWGVDKTVTTETRANIRLGDFEHVLRCVRRIRRDHRAWQQFFAERKIAPLLIRYEDLVSDQPGFVRRIAQRLKLDGSSYRIPPPERQDHRLPPDMEAARAKLLEQCAAAGVGAAC